MQLNDDIAFQRAILANPADTTLKLVYADWLQERGDPRAEYVRLQLALGPVRVWEGPGLWWKETEPLRKLAVELDPGWIALMESLAQPFEPIPFAYPESHYPFEQRIGRRGRAASFETQYRSVDDWSEGLLADLAFLTSMDWGQTGHDYGGYSALSFLCELPADGAAPPTPDEIRDRLLLAPAPEVPGLLPEHIAISPAEGAYDLDAPDPSRSDWEWRLRRHVTDGRRYDAIRHIERATHTEARPHFVGFAVGKSPHGNRLVGAFWRRWS
jgi:uncharacterized protein (TIGR02996 family)